MRLLFDATELSYYNEESGHRAGVFFVALNIFKELKKRNINITFCCDFRRYYFLKEVEEFKDIPLLKENSFINKLIGKILYKTDKFPLKIKYGLIILARIYDKYFYITNKKNFEQLKDFNVYLSPFTPPSKEITQSGLKRFRMIHDVIPIIEKGISKNPKDWHNKIYNTINNSDYYLTNSEYTKQDVLKHFPFIKSNHIKTTLLAANGKFKPEKAQDKNTKYIFSLCTLGKRKNLEFSIRNFFSFINAYKINDLKLVLGGSVWKRFEKDLNSILDKYDRSKVELTGYIQEDNLRKYYSNALCFIFPSLYEGFGLPVLEAMQCGCPVITSDRSSLPEVIGNAGIVINPENNTDMIEALNKMYFDESFRNECSQKGMERAKSFSWAKCTDEILDFIKSSS